MEIKIAKKGNARGTLGWLVRGLEDGTVKLVEGTVQKTNQHCLVMEITDDRYTDDRYIIAAYNQYNLIASDGVSGYDSYDITHDDIYHTYPTYTTPACRRKISEIARAWCDNLNM
jgi:hypothetical protein